MAQIPEYLKQPWPTTRQFERRPLETRLVLMTADKSRYRGWCQDVSEGGLGATVAVELKLGDEVSLEFDISTSTEPVSVRALVRYTDAFRHGFEFLTLTPTHRAAILAYVAKPESKRIMRRR